MPLPNDSMTFSQRLRALNHPVFCILLVASLYATFIFTRLAGYVWQPTAFLCIGKEFVYDGNALPVHAVINSSYGYDGQFFFRLALDPITRSQYGLGIVIDRPAYRQQRILYPMLAYLLAFGRARYVPYTMILVNYLALCAIAGLGGVLAMQYGRHALYGLIFPLYPGCLITLSRSTSEIVEMCFLLATLAALRGRQPLMTAATLTLALLAREQSVMLAVGLAAWIIIRFLGRRLGKIGDSNNLYAPPWYTAAIPLSIFFFWQTVLYVLWHSIALTGGASAFAPFFVDFLAHVRTSLNELVLTWENFHLMVYAVLGILAFWHSRTDWGGKNRLFDFSSASL